MEDHIHVANITLKPFIHSKEMRDFYFQVLESLLNLLQLQKQMELYPNQKDNLISAIRAVINLIKELRIINF